MPDPTGGARSTHTTAPDNATDNPRFSRYLAPASKSAGAEHLEAEGVGQPPGGGEGGADRQRVLDLLGRHAGGQHVPHVLGAQLAVTAQLAEHPQRCPQRLGDGSGVQVGQHRRDRRPVLVRPAGGRGVRADAERALVHLRYVGRHQLPVADRPAGRAAHRLVGELLRPGAVEIRPVEDQFGGVRHRVPGKQPDEREEQLGTGAVAAVQDVKPHCPASRRLLRPAPPARRRTAGRTGRRQRRSPARRADPR